MDLKEFTSPLPKPWLNINANSVHVGPGGGSVNSTVYSKIGATTISNTSAESPLSGGNAAAIGSRTLPPLSVGTVVKLRATGEFSYSTVAGGGWTVALTVNGTDVISFSPVGVSGNFNQAASIFEGSFTVLGGGNAAGLMTMDLQSFGLFGKTAPSAAGPIPFIPFDNTVSNTVDMTLKFGNASTSNNWGNAYTYTIELLSAA